MKAYSVPPDMSEKEKVIGGILNLNQFFWLIGGVALGAGVFFILVTALGAFGALFCALPFMVGGIPFAVYKKNDLTLYKYIELKRKFKRKTKKLPNICNPDNFESFLKDYF